MAGPMVLRKAATARCRLLSWSLLLVCCLAGVVSADQGEPIRVCADPNDLPYSNQQLQGFENKIAAIVAQDLGVELSYFWWPYQRGLVRNTIKRDQCDVLISIPKGYDPVLWTKPYYRSTHMLVYRSDRKGGPRSLDDPALRGLKIGVHTNSPPFDALGNRELMEYVVNYRLFFDPRDPDPAVRPERLLEDVVSGVVDVAVAWGPLVGYFLKQHPSASLEVVPLDDDPKLPMSYEFSMGVAKGNRDLKARLEGTLDRRQAEVRKVLEDYGVPLLPLMPPGKPVDEKQPPAGSHQHDSDNN